MELINSTEIPAKLITGSMSESELLGIIASKATYVLEQDSLHLVDESSAWPIFDQPFVYSGFTFITDLDFRKEGIDIVVFGEAVSPNGSPIKQMPISISCGNIRYELMVYGDRIWERHKDKLIPSDPKPFTQMPLTNDRAYGGVATWEGLELAHDINPDGKGFYMSEKEAEGSPLPNLERPGSLIQSWEDRPKPACILKPKGLFLDSNINKDNVKNELPKMFPSFFSNAVPELIAKKEDLGDVIEFKGFSTQGNIVFPVPSVEGPVVEVRVGELESVFPSHLSSMVILVGERVLVATYLCLFRYLFRPQEERIAKIHWSHKQDKPKQQ